MKVLLEKLNNIWIKLSTIVVVLVVLICHVFILEVNVVDDGEKGKIIEKKIKNIDGKQDKYEKVIRTVVASTITIDYYIRIEVSSSGNTVTANIYKNNTTTAVDRAISDCINVSNIKNNGIIITDLNIITTAQYGIVIENKINTGNTSSLDIKMSGSNSIVVKGDNSSTTYCGLVLTNSGNKVTSLNIEGSGSLDIDVNATNGNGISSDKSFTLGVGSVEVDSPNQGIVVENNGSCTVNSTNGSVTVNGIEVSSGTLGQDDLADLIPPLLPESYYLRYHVENNTETMYAVKSDGSEVDVTNDLPNGIEISNKTITLTNYEFTPNAEHNIALKITGNQDVTVQYKGTNEIKSTIGTAIVIDTDKTVTFKQSSDGGTLTIEGSAAGISAEGNLEIQSGTLTAISTAATSTAIKANAITILDGTVTATVSGINATGIRAEGGMVIGDVGDDTKIPEITVNRPPNTELQSNQNDGEDLSNDGIFSNGGLTVHNGTVKVIGYFGNGIETKGNQFDIKGGTIDITASYKGMWVEGGISISGGNITAKATSTSTNWNAGIFITNSDFNMTEGNLTIEATGDDNARGIVGVNGADIVASGGVINISVSSVEDVCYGIKGESSVTIDIGTVEISVDAPRQIGIYAGSGGMTLGKVGYANNIVKVTVINASTYATNIDSKGLYSDGNITINSGIMTIGNNLVQNFANGIHAGGRLIVVNGEINSIALYHSIISTGDMTVSGGTVTAKSILTNNICYGIRGDSNVNITNGSVDVTVASDNAAGIQVLNELTIGVENDNTKSPNVIVHRESDSLQANEQNVGNDINDGMYSKIITIHNGNVQVTGKFSNGIQCNSLNIKGGDIDVYGIYKGIWGAGETNISGGDVTSVAGTTNSAWNAGMLIGYPGITVSGGTVDSSAIGSTEARGIVAAGDASFSIIGGTVIATGEGPQSQGVLVDNKNININGGSVTATANGEYAIAVNCTGWDSKLNAYSGSLTANISGLNARGIAVNGNIVIGENVGDIGPTIKVTGDIYNNQSNINNVAGLCGYNTVRVNAGDIEINIQSTNSEYNQSVTGLYIGASFVVNGGVTTINTNTLRSDGSYGLANGIYAMEDININSGEIESNTYGSGYSDAGAFIEGSLNIKGGKSTFKNTNNSNGYGVVAWNGVSVTGGHAIMHGENYAINSTSISYTGTTAEQGKAMMVRASEDYSATTLVEYVSSANDTYKYVEFGVLYSMYLKFSNGTLYKGDSEVAYTPTELDDLSISLDMYDSNKITLSGTTFNSNVKYGLYSDRNLTLVLADGTTNQIDCAGAADGSTYGAIYVNGILTLEGTGELVVKGNSRAIMANNVIFTKGTDVELAVHEAGIAYDETNPEIYPSIYNWSGYKYVKIAVLEDYYFKYNADDGEMFSVYVKPDGSDKAEKKLASPNELKSGWSILSDGEGGHILQLNEFNLTTRAPYGIKIIGDGVLNLAGSNVITTTDNKYNHYTGLYVDGDITISGNGSIETIRGNNAANNIGINITGDAVINGGTYTVDNVSTGIQSDGDLTITNSTCNMLTNVATGIDCKGDLTISNSNCDLSANINGIKMAAEQKLTINNSSLEVTGKARAIDLGTSTQSDIYESVWASTAENGDNSVEISNINERVRNSGTGNANLSTFKSIDMDIPVYSVDITWGAFEYELERSWNPSNHIYLGTWRVDTANHGDMIKIENSVNSNASVKATISHNIDEVNEGIGVTFVADKSIQEQLEQDVNSVQEVLPMATGVLQRYLVLSGVPKNVFNTPTGIGNVLVTLEDNID